MRYDYDVIVVGAGNGGLAAASELAGAGLKTLLLEKHNLPGGVATSFVRGRFEFEASLHELCNVGTEEMPLEIRDVLGRLGSDTVFRNEKNLFRAIVTGDGGYDVTISAGEENFERSMLEVCPESEKSLKKLKKLIKKSADAIKYNDSKGGKPNRLVMMMKYGAFLISASSSLDDVLRSLGFSLRARSILETYWSYLGVPADELNAFHYFEMLRGYINGGAGIPENKSYGISLSLAEAVLKRGGTIRYNAEVTHFIYDENKRAVGVAVGGDEYYAKEIVSNVIPHNVLGMSGGKNVPERDKKLLNARKFGMSFICIYLGLDETAEKLGINDYSVFIARKASSRSQYRDASDMGMYAVNCLSTAIPAATPEGTCSLFFSIPVIRDTVTKNVTPEGYKKFKSDVAAKYIEDYEKVVGVQIKEHIEEISVATPATFARYFGSPNGTAYGYELSGWDGLIARILSKGSELNIDGLTFCGGHSASGDGFGVAYTSGIEAAGKVIEKLKGENGNG
ncbi:MAG: NAD(P)/FAD-dependent oxidoreductase [Clostridia bacterium]|nr:NAD(P)/FAD-dependent oxidoreductase [Clostridia bacterium]